MGETSQEKTPGVSLCPPITSFKLLVVGPSGAGKTSLVVRACSGLTPHSPHATVVADNFLYFIRHEDKRIRLDLWDTAGQERFSPLVPLYYRGASGAIVVYDMTDRASFIAAQEWIRRLTTLTSGMNVTVLLGNKMDLLSEPSCPRAVSRQEAEDYAQSLGLLYKETSAVSGEGLEEALLELGQTLLEKGNPVRRQLFPKTKPMGYWPPSAMRIRLQTIPETPTKLKPPPFPPSRGRGRHRSSSDRGCC